MRLWRCRRARRPVCPLRCVRHPAVQPDAPSAPLLPPLTDDELDGLPF